MLVVIIASTALPPHDEVFVVYRATQMPSNSSEESDYFIFGHPYPYPYNHMFIHWFIHFTKDIYRLKFVTTHRISNKVNFLY